MGVFAERYLPLGFLNVAGVVADISCLYWVSNAELWNWGKLVPEGAVSENY